MQLNVYGCSQRKMLSLIGKTQICSDKSKERVYKQNKFSKHGTNHCHTRKRKEGKIDHTRKIEETQREKESGVEEKHENKHPII